MRISDWSSDVCSSDLPQTLLRSQQPASINLVRSCYLSGAFDPPSRSDGTSGVDRLCRAAGGPTSSYGASGAGDWARRPSRRERPHPLSALAATLSTCVSDSAALYGG